MKQKEEDLAKMRQQLMDKEKEGEAEAEEEKGRGERGGREEGGEE